MLKILLLAKFKFLSTLPVSFARKHLHNLIKESVLALPTSSNVNHKKQLLVDVSVIIGIDSRTGIQRVVRAILLYLLKNPPTGINICPIYCDRKHAYQYASYDFDSTHFRLSRTEETRVVNVEAGDIFLGLDLAAHLLPFRAAELAQWKVRGVKIHMVIYDLLPLLHPHWFNPKTTRNFHRWLKTVVIYSDSIICISNVVKLEVNVWLARQYRLNYDSIPVSTISLGANIKETAPSLGLPENVNELMAALTSRLCILMVGTIEPRKGHTQVLDIFNEIWLSGQEVNLVIVGKPGWKTEALQQSLRIATKKQKKLFWLESVSDEFLELLYAGSDGVLVASYAEGYGLPLVEALTYGKSVLARDISVFREIAAGDTRFFPDKSKDDMLRAVKDWLHYLTSKNAVVTSAKVNALTWKETCDELIKILENDIENVQLDNAILKY